MIKLPKIITKKNANKIAIQIADSIEIYLKAHGFKPKLSVKMKLINDIESALK